MKNLFIPILAILLFSSCVGKKKFLDAQTTRDQLKTRAENCEKELTQKLSELESERSKLKNLQEQLDYMKATNTNLLDRLADLSVISQSSAESIKKSLDAINEQSKYIKDLTTNIQRKDSLNLALVTTLKRSLSDVDDKDVNIEVKKGVVYISLSDKLLFRSGSAKITPKAEEVLGKIAKILNDQKELEILVEGHTDTVPISTDCFEDNWDLSVKRATSVVRLLQTKYSVTPSRMTAGGRSEYLPKTSNESVDGRGVNRRTEIIILPKLDQFFELMAPANE